MKEITRRTIAYILAAVLALTMTAVPVFADEMQDNTDENVIADSLTRDETISDPAAEQDNDELFMLYVEERLAENAGMDGTASEKAASRLMRRVMPTGINANIYNSLRRQIKKVADGESNSAVFTVTLEEFGLEKYSWTAVDLGVSAIVKDGSITQEAKTALTKELGINIRTVLTALLFDCPYDLYWYDKEKGVKMSGPGISAEQTGGEWTIRVSSGLTLYFTVADGYSAGNDYEVDTSRIERVNHAVDKAAAIVESHSNETDRGILVSYKEEICDLVVYDYDAASDSDMPYGDPWQVISVFDEDETTNVVCEGYSKAFQYLCDITDFEGNISCISVDGYMDGGTGSGSHMWNIVCMGDGTNLLADITNCDAGTIGEPDQLFLKGYTSGDVEAGYTFSCAGGMIRYNYGHDTVSTFDDELVLASEGACIHDLVRTEGIAATCTEGGTADYWTCSACGKMYSDPDAVNEITEAVIPTEPLGHDWGEWTVTIHPSISSEGKEQRTCLRDASHMEERTVPAIVIDSVYRLYGSTRYDTALKVADDLKEKLGLDRFDMVILADGRNYADALAGSYLSCLKSAPILLVDGRQSRIDTVKNYIEDNLSPGGTIYMLGGSAAVPDAAVEGLSGYTVKRLGGTDRYATNLEILKEAEKTGDEVMVASGNSFADSLSAAALGRPVILTKQSLNDSQKQYLASFGGSVNFVIIGGKAAVSEDIKDELTEYGTVERVGGSSRYETSANVARRFFKEPKTAVLAYGQTFPDGLCGGALAYTINGPLILAANGKTAEAIGYAKETGIKFGAVLGGSKLITDDDVRDIFKMSEGDEIVIINN